MDSVSIAVRRMFGKIQTVQDLQRLCVEHPECFALSNGGPAPLRQLETERESSGLGILVYLPMGVATLVRFEREGNDLRLVTR